MLERTTGGLRDALSPRERQLLNLAARGFTDNAIANKLGISLATVGTYWGRVRIKFGPLNRTELVAIYLKEEASQTVAQLRGENDRLAQELQQHAKTARMLQASLEMFRGLIETAPDAILVVNQDGLVELANEQAEEMFSYSKHELLGIKIEELIPIRFQEHHVGYRHEYNAHPVKRRMAEHMSTYAMRKDGSEFPMATALSATPTPSGLLVTCIVRDLSSHLEEQTATLSAEESDQD